MSTPDDDRTLIAPSPEPPADAAKPDQPSFLDPIPGIIPFGSICTFAGASGVGKTALYATWIARWQANQAICGHPTNPPTEIGILVGDRRWASHRQWLDVAGVSSSIKHYSLRDDDTFQWNDLKLWPKVRDMFARALDKLSLAPGSLLIVDPLALWIPGRTNDYKDVAIGLGVLDYVIKPRQLTMLGIFHQSKQISDKSQQYARPQDRILGSAATIGFSDTAMYLLGPEDLSTPYYGFGWIPHNAPAETHKFVRDGWGLFVPYLESSEFDQIEAVADTLPLDPHGVSVPQLLHLCKQSGYEIARSTLYACLKKLVQDGRAQQPVRGKYRRAQAS